MFVKNIHFTSATVALRSSGLHPLFSRFLQSNLGRLPGGFSVIVIRGHLFIFMGQFSIGSVYSTPLGGNKLELEENRFRH